MSTDTTDTKRDGAAGQAGDTKRKFDTASLEELEKRVLFAELRAREVEAEVRYFVATKQRRELRADKRNVKAGRDDTRQKRETKRSRKGETKQGEN